VLNMKPHRSGRLPDVRLRLHVRGHVRWESAVVGGINEALKEMMALPHMRNSARTAWSVTMTSRMPKPPQSSGTGKPGKPDDHAFTVDAALLFQLGEELVNRRSVALAELIKNAYDADASKVTVRLLNVSKPGGTIEIEDDGSGMNYDALLAKWFRIATRAKVDEPFSKRLKRSRAGAKGVGRFAARRLAESLVLESTARVEHGAGYESVSATFDWADFVPGLVLEQIKIPVTRKDVVPEKGGVKTGLTLRLLRVREAWTVEDVTELQADLLRLVTPPKKGNTDQFKVVLEAPEFPSFAGDLGDRFLQYGLITLKGKLDEAGRASYELKVRGKKEVERFSPKDPPKQSKASKGDKDDKPEVKPIRFPLVGEASFEVVFFVYKSTFFAGLPIKTRDAQARGREHGGVHIYVDRFRVPPYGDPGDDWLNLDEDRGRRLDATPEELEEESTDIPGRPMLLLPGNNQLFGSVHLSRELNESLQQTVNRERFIENAAFKELRTFVRLGINWMTVEYAAYLAEQRKKTAKPTPEELLGKARDKFAQTIGDSALGDEERAEVLQAFDLAMHAVQTRQDELISELSMLRVLASTGTMIAVFEHQLLASLSGLRELAGRVEKLVKQAPPATRQKVADESDELKGWIRDLQHQADLIGLLVSKEARARRRRVVVHDAVDSIAKSFGSFMDENAIQFKNAVPDTLKTPSIYPAEVTAILLNLFTNALKAVQHVSTRRIEASAERRSGECVVRLSDTGVGADPDQWEEFFLPFKTTSTPDPMLGHGTGLGLKIVRDIAAVYGGTARFVTPQAPWKTTLEISFPES
jgi:signal transduction histidine kinase